MYGGSKLGRGGGRAGVANKRNSFPPPPPHRLSTPSSSNRLSLGSSAARSRVAGPGSGASAGRSKAVEETFSLVCGNNPLAFAMIIRLAPDLVEEIKKVESQGGVARMKFDSTGYNPNGNVIDISGKEFRFTWSREFGDLCDIYEERQSDEDGNGLLVESGCAWRKLNVQRILDESTTNHVKMRSVEAERKHKSRKAIVLDHGNPSMKSQIKQLAAVEANTWKSYKQKKEPPFKKQKVETLQVGGPPKSTHKSGGASTASLKAGRSASPLPSPSAKSGTPASPNGSGSIVKNHVNTDEVTPIQVKSKENVPNTEKEIPTRINSAAWEIAGGKGNSGAKPSDLKSMLITLLMENPKGMTLKALEKAVGDVIPSSAKKIEPILKKIATIQTLGRYSLKPVVNSSKKPTSESGSSPEDNRQQTRGPENIIDQMPAPGPSFVENIPDGEMEEQAQSNSKLEEESFALEKIDVQHYSPDLFGEKKVSDNSEGQAANSSDSGSDSDSESDSSDSGSDSGSHSRSRSKSRSPARSGGGSSSDSESGASSNSKEASDEDVDIMTSDDDKEPRHKLPTSEPGLLVSPIPWKSDDSRPVRNEIDEKQDDDASDAIDIEGHDAVDIEKDLSDDGQGIDKAVNTSLVPSKDAEKAVEGNKNLTDHDELRERQNFIGNLFDEKETLVKDSIMHERSNTPERTSKNKSKKGPDSKHIDETSKCSKRSKVESLARRPISEGRDTKFLKSPHNLSPNRFFEDPYKGPSTQMMSRADRERNTDFVFPKGYNQEVPGKYNSDFQQSGGKCFDQSARSKAHDTAERPNNHGRRISENSFQTQNEDGFVKEKKGSRNFKEGGAEDKNSGSFDFINGKHSEKFKKDNETGQVSSSHIRNGKASVLQRVVSDLELGELREPLPNEAPMKKQIDRKGSFKQSDNKSSTSDNYNPDLSKGKLVGKATLETGKSSPPNFRVGMKRTPENHVEDSTRTHNRVGQSQSHNLSGVDHAEVGSQFNKSMDGSSKPIQNEAGARLGGGQEGYGESHKKAPTSALQHDSKRVLVFQSVKENKAQKTSNTMADLVDGHKDTIMTESNDSGRKKRESSSDEDTCSYYKYEKDEPELKGPIKDFSQYKEYMLEYRDKYEGYLSLNKLLESYRNKFHKLGQDIEFAKEKDRERYYKLLEQLNDSYRQCGSRHKRLKKVFVVLHEELKHLKQRMKDFAHTYMKD